MKIRKFNESVEEIDWRLNCLLLFHEGFDAPLEEYNKIYTIIEREINSEDDIFEDYKNLPPEAQDEVMKIIDDYIKSNF